MVVGESDSQLDFEVADVNLTMNESIRFGSMEVGCRSNWFV